MVAEPAPIPPIGTRQAAGRAVAGVRSIPGPRGFVFGARLRAFRRDPLEFLTMLAREYGDVASVRFGRREVVLVSDPELIREILVTRNRNFIKSRALQRARTLLGAGLLTSEGELHLRQRRLIQPAFHRDRIDAYAPVMSEVARRQTDGWVDGAEIDAAREMMRITLAIVARTLFDAEVEGEASEIADALTAAMSLMDRLTIPFGEILDHLPLPATRRFQRARARLDATIFRIIAERRASGVERGDLLSLLLAAEDAADGRGMTDAQLRDEALTLFLAGHETTANALAWTWHLLAGHQEAERRMHAELDAVLDGRAPVAADLPRLPYTMRVLHESMRLYPPAWSIGRQPLADFELGGYRVPAGCIILMSPWVVHRDARFFSDPLRFDPDRWLPERETAHLRSAYFPFGGGPRKCIGEGFAWMEGSLVLATLASVWRLRSVPGHPVSTLPLITLRPRRGLRMRLQRRRPGESA